MSSKSTFSNNTSKSYAVALFELSKDNSELDRVVSDIKNLDKLIKESLDFKEMILNPTVSKEDKIKVISKIADQNNFSRILKNFLGFIAFKNRLFFLSTIIQSFLNLVSDSKGEIKAKLISSKQLSSEQKEKIQNELSKDFKSNLNIEYEHDPNLIAGLVIQVGSIMVDTSIRTKLKKLERSMIEV